MAGDELRDTEQSLAAACVSIRQRQIAHQCRLAAALEYVAGLEAFRPADSEVAAVHHAELASAWAKIAWLAGPEQAAIDANAELLLANLQRQGELMEAACP